MTPNPQLNDEEIKLLRDLSTPVKIQDYLETLRANFDDTCMSPRRVIRTHKAHCLEGAMLAALALWLHGKAPLLLDLRSKRHDDDHVVALFRVSGRWGALSKTNHAVLRYREPIYLSVRELAVSFFHEYFLDSGEKTMLSYSTPLDMRSLAKKRWMTDETDLWYVSQALDAQKHFSVALPRTRLRRADDIEIKAGKIVAWQKPRRLKK